jgi:hypothetical protein
MSRRNWKLLTVGVIFSSSKDDAIRMTMAMHTQRIYNNKPILYKKKACGAGGILYAYL